MLIGDGRPDRHNAAWRFCRLRNEAIFLLAIPL
jgi:hypothetical protein